MTTPRVLYDLSFGVDTIGFSGIPQDTRLLFSALSQSEAIDLVGWIHPYGQSRLSSGQLDDIISQAEFLGPFLSNLIDQRDVVAKILSRLRLHRVAQLWQLYVQDGRDRGELYRVHRMFGDLVWRRFFASTVPPDNRQRLANWDYYISKIGAERCTLAALGIVPTPRVNTQNFDYIVTQDTRVLRVSGATRKIVRYHDGIPVTASDTFESTRPTRVHVKAIRKASSDTLFVCNSSSAQNDLANISEVAARHSVVIPYFIPTMRRVEPTRNALMNIARNRLSPSTLPEQKRRAALDTWFGSGAEIPPFIMSLATIEPRKNYLRLIEAWQQLRIFGPTNLKLVIVGSPGWAYDKIIAAMRPHVERGDLLHLEKVAQSELPVLYSAASVFCFPSVAEGFGLPPTEAMQCGCPVVVSDIAAHRYMAGDAAEYCDPYNVEEIAAAISRAMSPEGQPRLVQRGFENVKRFSHESVLPQWEQLFDSLHPPRS